MAIMKNMGLIKINFSFLRTFPQKNIFKTYEINPEKIMNKEKLVIGYIGAVAYYSSLKALFEA